MSDYDTWKCTPPDDRGYCPHCYADAEGALPACEDDESEGYLCGYCGRTFDAPLSRDEMMSEAREEAAIQRAEARMDEEL